MVVGLTRPTIPVTITQTPATVSVTPPPDTVGFNETLAVDGRVAHDGVGAANVSYRLLAGEQLLAEGQTNATGNVSESIPLPATIPTGDQPLRLTAGTPQRALTPGNGTTTVSIRERPTTLSVNATQTNDVALAVAGDLRVPGGPGVPRRSVELFVNGTSVGTTTTGVNGTFETTIIAPDAALGGGYFESVSQLSVEATYEDTTANLERSSAETTAVFTTGPVWNWLAGLGLVVLIAAGAGGALLSWRRNHPEQAPGDAVEGTAGWQPSRSDQSVSVESLLEQARARIAAEEPVAAAQLAYAAIRAHLEAESGNVSVQTHWEFYRACQGAGADDTVAVLRDATELYERVVFASESVSEETIAPLLERIERVIEPTSTDG